MIGMGFVKDFKSLLITRVFLGITEAGEWKARVLPTSSKTDVERYQVSSLVSLSSSPNGTDDTRSTSESPCSSRPPPLPVLSVVCLLD